MEAELVAGIAVVKAVVDLRLQGDPRNLIDGQLIYGAPRLTFRVTLPVLPTKALVYSLAVVPEFA